MVVDGEKKPRNGAYVLVLLNEIALHQKLQQEVIEQFLDHLEKAPALTAEEI